MNINWWDAVALVFMWMAFMVTPEMAIGQNVTFFGCIVVALICAEMGGRRK
jgi:hypothetical protein